MSYNWIGRGGSFSASRKGAAVILALRAFELSDGPFVFRNYLTIYDWTCFEPNYEKVTHHIMSQDLLFHSRQPLLNVKYTYTEEERTVRHLHRP